VAGVLFGRPFAWREHAFIWPTTFFLFTWSAAAYGPCFTIALVKLTEKITGKKLVKDSAVHLLAKISGWMILTYSIAKSIDTLYWMTQTDFMAFYSNNPLYTIPMLFFEIVICGFVPGIMLITGKVRQMEKLLVAATVLGIIGVSLNRWVMVLQVMAVPVMPFDQWYMYIPSWQEIATTILPVAYGVILVSLSYRYLPVFPDEAELNPIAPAETAAGEASEEDAAAGGDLQPAEA
jgi:molybdopterin-containing oxidoreductase family membrane subunit